RRRTSSANTNAPRRAISAPSPQASRVSWGLLTRAATTAELRKIPEPMIPPITIIVAENTPSRRAYPGEFSGSLRVKWRLRGGFWAATFLRGPGSRGCSPRTRPIADDAFRPAVALRAPVDLQL